MPPRAIWTGSISFGLVNVPIRLVTAVRKKDVSFNQLHDADGARIEYRRVCSADGEEVPYEHIAKGYEVAKGHYVLITPEELAALDPEASRTIDIEDFVEAAEIDPIYFQHPYYVAPDGRAGDKAYALLVDVMQRTGKVAIGRFVMRSKQYLCVLRAVDGVLVLSTMLYFDEVVPGTEVEGASTAGIELSSRELDMAEQLVETLTTKFDPERYRDEYREQVLELIDKKAEGIEIAEAPAPAPRPAVVDLVAALEASLEEARSRETG